MASNLKKLMQKRDQLDKEIALAQQLEKRKARVSEIVFSELEKHERAALASDEILRKGLDELFAKLAQNSPAA